MTQILNDLSRKARNAESDRELAFSLVNDTMALVPYRQAALWLAEEGVWSLSGVVQVDANVPYVQWLNSVAQYLHAKGGDTFKPFTASDLPENLAAEWEQWLPSHALWLGSTSARIDGAVLLVRDFPWTNDELEILQHWTEVWWHAFTALYHPRMVRLKEWRNRLSQLLSPTAGQPWWRQRRYHVSIAMLLVLLFPVRLSVLVPGELVAAQPTVIRSPLDGVIDVFHVQPNQLVALNQLLFSFDAVLLQSRLDVAQQSLATAETEYRQTSQLALTDSKFKTQLGLLIGKVEERRAEIDYLQEQLTRANVLAPGPGVVLMDDPSEWIGKPVVTGERILRIAMLDDAEVQAWVPLADAISLHQGDEVVLYLSASPLSPVAAQVRYMSHDAVQRPDGTYAYRLRAVLKNKTSHRIGQKGTAKLHGSWVPLSYWVLRRPWAAMRTYLGW